MNTLLLILLYEISDKYCTNWSGGKVRIGTTPNFLPLGVDQPKLAQMPIEMISSFPLIDSSLCIRVSCAVDLLGEHLVIFHCS